MCGVTMKDLTPHTVVRTTITTPIPTYDKTCCQFQKKQLPEMTVSFMVEN